MQTVLVIIVILSGLALIASVLLQEGNSAGMSGAIQGGAESLFGKKKAQGMQGLLNKITLVSAIAFFVSVLALNIVLSIFS